MDLDESAHAPVVCRTYRVNFRHYLWPVTLAPIRACSLALRSPQVLGIHAELSTGTRFQLGKRTGNRAMRGQRTVAPSGGPLFTRLVPAKRPLSLARSAVPPRTTAHAPPGTPPRTDNYSPNSPTPCGPSPGPSADLQQLEPDRLALRPGQFGPGQPQPTQRLQQHISD